MIVDAEERGILFPEERLLNPLVEIPGIGLVLFGRRGIQCILTMPEKHEARTSTNDDFNAEHYTRRKRNDRSNLQKKSFLEQMHFLQIGLKPANPKIHELDRSRNLERHQRKVDILLLE